MADCFAVEQYDPTVVDAHRQAAEGQSKTLDMHWKDRIYNVHVEPFRQADGRLIGTIGVAVDVTDQKLIDLELRLTRRIHTGLLPSSSPQLERFDIAGASFSLAEAGGDYFDYFPISDGATGIVVCDVGGHGLGPAMMMCHTRAYLRALALTFEDPGQILSLVNRFLCDDIKEERLVTLFFAKLDPREGTLTYANAGHQGYLLRADHPAQFLKPTGIPLNVLEEASMASAPPMELVAGDLILLYTDGIVESLAPDGNQFGTERILSVVRTDRDKTAREIIDGVFASVHGFSPKDLVADDMTAVVIKVR